MPMLATSSEIFAASKLAMAGGDDDSLHRFAPLQRRAVYRGDDDAWKFS